MIEKVVCKVVDRNKYDPVIDFLCLIGSHYNECRSERSIQEIRCVKGSFDIKLMFVGHFNAGKSSLPNGLIERPGFLKEAQLPQTAVAAELRCDETERSFAYRRNGAREPLTERAACAPNEYGHLEYRLPAPGLRQVSNYTIFLNVCVFDGKEFLPKAATPMTAALTKITYSETPKAVVHFYNQEDWDKVLRESEKYDAGLKRDYEAYCRQQERLQMQSQAS